MLYTQGYRAIGTVHKKFVNEKRNFIALTILTKRKVFVSGVENSKIDFIEWVLFEDNPEFEKVLSSVFEIDMVKAYGHLEKGGKKNDYKISVCLDRIEKLDKEQIEELKAEADSDKKAKAV